VTLSSVDRVVAVAEAVQQRRVHLAVRRLQLPQHVAQRRQHLQVLAAAAARHAVHVLLVGRVIRLAERAGGRHVTRGIGAVVVGGEESGEPGTEGGRGVRERGCGRGDGAVRAEEDNVFVVTAAVIVGGEGGGGGVWSGGIVWCNWGEDGGCGRG